MNWTRTWTLLLLLGGSCASACNGETTESVGSETNWLDPCTADDDCSEGRCLCGVCTKECDEVAGCDDDTMLCASNQSLAHGKLCADVPMAPEGLCLWACNDGQCPEGNHCEAEACLPDPVRPPPQPCSDESECTDATNASPVCAQGFCAIASCKEGFGDCNDYQPDGCETNITAGDSSNCGACGNPCDAVLPHVAELGCANFGCVIVDCEHGWAASDADDANGCETDLRSDEDNCGDLGAACDTGQQCVGGTCQTVVASCVDVEDCVLTQNAEPVCIDSVCSFSSCDSGFDDCNDNAIDGCETNVASGDTLNCGTCDNPCDQGWSQVATFQCVDYQCQIDDCEPGWGDCDDNRFNGCETDLMKDDANCGTCGAACEIQYICNQGKCQWWQ